MKYWHQLKARVAVACTRLFSLGRRLSVTRSSCELPKRLQSSERSQHPTTNQSKECVIHPLWFRLGEETEKLDWSSYGTKIPRETVPMKQIEPPSRIAVDRQQVLTDLESIVRTGHRLLSDLSGTTQAIPSQPVALEYQDSASTAILRRQGLLPLPFPIGDLSSNLLNQRLIALSWFHFSRENAPEQPRTPRP